MPKQAPKKECTRSLGRAYWQLLVLNDPGGRNLIARFEILRGQKPLTISLSIATEVLKHGFPHLHASGRHLEPLVQPKSVTSILNPHLSPPITVSSREGRDATVGG